jgi:NAD(P)-dependent dehydrogenase (short-subunit alcohol dehydrogenase family)
VDADRPVALVTGANRGIGKAVADGLAAAGLTVIRGARAPDPRDTSQQRLDITDPRSVAQLVGGLERLDALVNNAGVLLDSGTRGVDADLDVARRTLETNLFGSWQLTQACIPLLRASPHPRIVNLSSGMGQLDEMGGGSPGYRISKTALNALTRILSVELAGCGRAGERPLPRLGAHRHGRSRGHPHARTGGRHGDLAGHAARQRAYRRLLPRSQCDPVVAGW